MKVYIFRHGIAEERGQGMEDRDRKLTARGVAQLKEVTRGLNRLRVKPDEILASPYRRAWETAVIAGKGLERARKPVECAALTPSSTVERAWSELKKHADQSAVMLVGHEPLLSEFAAFLIGAPHVSITLKKAGLIRIDVGANVTRPAGVLRWLLTAPHLARLG